MLFAAGANARPRSFAVALGLHMNCPRRLDDEDSPSDGLLDMRRGAQALAMQLARALGAELMLLHVAVETPPSGPMRVRELELLFEEQREWAKRALEERAAECRAQGVPTLTRVVSGTAHDKIVETAEQEGAAFIVMGTYGRGAVERFLLGSVADRVVRTAPCAVVTAREGRQEGRK
jgi:nucleotide-binding universal stress UspA family protein